MVELVKKDEEKPANERNLEGLLETIILFTKKPDFERVQQPLKIDIKPLYKEAPSEIEGLLREMKEWGDIDRDTILQRINVIPGMPFTQFAMGAIKALNDITNEKKLHKEKIKKLETDKKVKEIETL